ncbi:MAG: hypothetical protein ACRDOI_03980 [Trebonia sp.]
MALSDRFQGAVIRSHIDIRDRKGQAKFRAHPAHSMARNAAASNVRDEVEHALVRINLNVK